MLYFVIGWLIGSLTILTQTTIPTMSWSLILLLIGLGSIACMGSRLSIPRLVGAGLSLSAAWTIWQIQPTSNTSFAALSQPLKADVIGVISSLPKQSPHSSVITLNIEQYLYTSRATASLPLTLRVVASDRFGQRLPPWQAGERWHLSLQIQSNQGVLNPGLLDKETWLYHEQITASAYLQKGHASRESIDNSLTSKLLRIRHWFSQRIDHQLGKDPQKGLIKALTIGDQQEISPADWQTYRQLGLTHLVSISGLHITLLAWLAMQLAGWCWRRSARLCLWIPAPYFATTLGMLTAFGYTLLSGWSIPAQRTLYMLLIAGCIRLSGKNITLSNQLACALLVVCLLDPLAVLSPGTWLSFGAVAILVWSGSGYLLPPTKLGLWTRTQLGLFLIMSPTLILMFQQISLIGPVANLIAVPVVSWLVTPLALLGLVVPLMLSIAAAIQAGLMWCLQPLSEWSWSAITIGSPGIPLTLLATIGGSLLLTPKHWPGKWFGALLLLPVWLPSSQRPSEGELHVVILDVGQGLAVHLQTANHDLIFDTGPKVGEFKDSGRDILVPYLQQVGVHHLSALIVSHDDSDHSGGALSLLASVPTTSLISSLPDTHPITQQVPRHQTCHQDQAWDWDGVRFMMLSPNAEALASGQLRDNQKSCVLKIETAQGSLMIPADAESDEEAAIITHYAPEKLKSTVLIAGHHGSKTSSTPEWINAVAPKEVIFTAGRHNRYGHPHPTIVQRYQTKGIRTWTSAVDGAITLDFRGGKYDIKGERSSHASFWHTSHH